MTVTNACQKYRIKTTATEKKSTCMHLLLVASVSLRACVRVFNKRVRVCVRECDGVRACGVCI